MSDNPGDWFDWFGGEGGESGGGGEGGGEGGGDFSDGLTSFIFHPITLTIAAVFGLASACQPGVVSRTAQTASPSSFSAPNSSGPRDLPDFPDFPQRDERSSPPSGMYPQTDAQSREPINCDLVIADAIASFGRGWETTIQGEERDVCQHKIRLAIDREARRSQQGQQDIQSDGGPRTFTSDRPPQLITDAKPEYPPRALERGREGSVVIEFTVGADGRVESAVVISSYPPGLFDGAALRALHKRRYEPRRINGRPVASERMRADFQFEMRD